MGLGCLVCKKCQKFVNTSTFTRDEMGIEEYCTWCGDGGKLVCCDFCEKAYCKHCVKRNLGKDFLKVLLDADESMKWKCFVCDTTQLESLREECDEILKKTQKDQAQVKPFNDKKVHIGGPSQEERMARLNQMKQLVSSQSQDKQQRKAQIVSSFSRPGDLKELPSRTKELGAPKKPPVKQEQKPLTNGSIIGPTANKSNMRGNSLLPPVTKPFQTVVQPAKNIEIPASLVKPKTVDYGIVSKMFPAQQKPPPKMYGDRMLSNPSPPVNNLNKLSKPIDTAPPGKKKQVIMLSEDEESGDEIVIVSKSGKKKTISKSVLKALMGDDSDSGEEKKKSTKKTKPKKKNTEDESSPPQSSSEDDIPLAKQIKKKKISPKKRNGKDHKETASEDDASDQEEEEEERRK